MATLGLAFFLGRESVSMPEDFASAVSELQAHIQLQQRDVDRLIQSNRSNITAAHGGAPGSFYAHRCAGERLPKTIDRRI
jgi:hypothetical protein